MREMNWNTYLHSVREQVEKSPQLFKDRSVFDFSYLPQEPLMRDEAKSLIKVMLEFESTGLVEHQAIIGTRGSGKTMTVKHLQRMLQQSADLDVFYVNCREHNTSFKIFAHFLGVQPRGVGLEELYERFRQATTRRTVVILDEIDLMSLKDRRREILYFLSRSDRPYLVVMLCNSPQVLKDLDPATRSSLQPVPLHFRNYNAEQLGEILRDRATRGLHSWDEGMLAQIAAMTTQLANSDARVAIKTLQYVVMAPGEALSACFERARRDVVFDLITDLSDANLLVLWAVSTDAHGLAKDVYRRYCRLSADYRAKPFSYMYYYTSLSYLQSTGVVLLAVTKVERAYTNRVMLTCDRGLVGQICELRFGH